MAPVKCRTCACLNEKLLLNLPTKDILLLACIAAASVTFTSMGAMNFAVYWLFDGITFFISGCLAFCTLRLFAASGQEGCNHSGKGSDTSDVAVPKAPDESASTSKFARIRFRALGICSFSIFCLCTELGFLAAAIALFGEQMNPWAITNYGRQGRSFVVCSITSAALNSVIVYRFQRMLAATK
eukprot:TRINITY_DN111159_c0_g1_i1.p1 TRINITY_DN111159_c0_g1~~TRINITY_DN111159_c0_g1_i1.p1  ORF type:complete len:205 (+),score=48.71 TRINITY_DN111159_c0_g1_i1:64-615(+)